MKNDKTKPIIWATVALVIGVIIGTFLIGPMITTGNATAIAKNLAGNNVENVLKRDVLPSTPYTDFAGHEIKEYAKKNNISLDGYLVVRESTDGLLIPGTFLVFDLEKFAAVTTGVGLQVIDLETGDMAYASTNGTCTTWKCFNSVCHQKGSRVDVHPAGWEPK